VLELKIVDDFGRLRARKKRIIEPKKREEKPKPVVVGIQT